MFVSESSENNRTEREEVSVFRRDAHCFCVHLVLCGHALSLLRGFFHGLAERFGVLHHGFELRVGEHPQQVIQDQNQLGGHHVAVLNLQ